MTWAYFSTASPFAMGARANLCPRGIGSATVTPAASSPARRGRIATATLSAGFSLSPASPTRWSIASTSESQFAAGILPLVLRVARSPSSGISETPCPGVDGTEIMPSAILGSPVTAWLYQS